MSIPRRDQRECTVYRRDFLEKVKLTHPAGSRLLRSRLLDSHDLIEEKARPNPRARRAFRQSSMRMVVPQDIIVSSTSPVESSNFKPFIMSREALCS